MANGFVPNTGLTPPWGATMETPALQVAAVVLTSDADDIKRLIRNSEGVVALTSTAAFEALLLGRPAWLLGSTAERIGFEKRVTAGTVARLIAAAARLLPALENAAFRRAWEELRR